MAPRTESGLRISRPASHRLLLRSILVVILKQSVLSQDSFTRAESAIVQGRVSFNLYPQGVCCPPLSKNTFTPSDTLTKMKRYSTTKTNFTGQYTCINSRWLSATVTSIRRNCTRSQTGEYFCNIPEEWFVSAIYIAFQDQCPVHWCARCVDKQTRTACDLCGGRSHLVQIKGPSDMVKYRDFSVKIGCRNPVRLELHAIAYQCTDFAS